MKFIHRRWLALCLITLGLGTAILPTPGAEPALSIEQRLAHLESAATSSSTVDTGDNAWLLASTALVLMMTAPGLILFYGGLVRRKNVLATMMHSLILMAVASVLWVLVGYSLAFGEGNAFFGNPMCFSTTALSRSVFRQPK